MATLTRVAAALVPFLLLTAAFARNLPVGTAESSEASYGEKEHKLGLLLYEWRMPVTVPCTRHSDYIATQALTAFIPAIFLSFVNIPSSMGRN